MAALANAKPRALPRRPSSFSRSAEGDRPSVTTPTHSSATPAQAVAEIASPMKLRLPIATSSGAQPRITG